MTPQPGERRSPTDDLVELPEGTNDELLAELFERVTVLEVKVEQLGAPPMQWRVPAMPASNPPFDEEFSSVHYVVTGTVELPAAATAARAVMIRNGGRATGSCRVNVGSNAALEDLNFTVAFYGDE